MTKNHKNTIYHILYGIMMLVIAFMIVWSYAHYEGPSIIEESFPEPLNFAEGWVDINKTAVDPSNLRDMDGTNVYEEFSIFHSIPEDITEGQYLCFRSKNIFFAVYMDGELVYEPYIQQNVMYTKSLGTRWNYVPIYTENAGKQIELRITKVYESGNSCIDHLCIGEPARAIMDTIGDKLVAFITCIFILFVGIILCIADIPVNFNIRKNHELLYLGLFSISTATWCLSETFLLQYYLGDSRTMQLLSCGSLMLIAIPMILYLNAAFGFKNRKSVPLLIGFSFISFALCIILHFTKIADFHETLHFTHIVLLVAAVVLFYIIIRYSYIMGKKSTKNMYRILSGIGLTCLSLATAIDLIRYYTGSSTDTAMGIRIGFLVFIICFGSASLEKTMNVVKLGVQTEFISQLAYKDGLTRIGNRTAFEEDLTDLEKIKDTLPGIGIIMFDVNDLKYVNDNLGHNVGDKLLLESASLIKEAFSYKNCKCFRIGGDEFAVLLRGEQVKINCKNGIEDFKKAMKAYNAQPDREFRISIAEGYALYDKTQTDKTLSDIYQQADQMMYENKKQIKAAQMPPAEYYRNLKMSR